MEKLKIGFVTCVQLGLSCMNAIYEAGGTLSLAITLKDEQSPNKSGRVFLDDFCERHGVELIKAVHINNPELVDRIRSADLDWLFIIGWSQIASEEVVNLARYGTLGMHPTLLPEGRGRAAIPWAILKGLDKTGVTLFRLDAGVDSGPIVDRVEIPLTPETTATHLYELAEAAHITLIKRVISAMRTGNVCMTPQDESRATTWPGRKPEDGEILASMSVFEAERMVRALSRPYPGAFVINGSEKWVIHSATVSQSPPQGSSFFSLCDGFLILEEIEKFMVTG